MMSLIVAATLLLAPHDEALPRVSVPHVGWVHYEWDEWTSVSEKRHVEGVMFGWCAFGKGSDGADYEFGGQLDEGGMALLGYALSLRWDDRATDPQAAAASVTAWNPATCMKAAGYICGAPSNVCKVQMVNAPAGFLCSIFCGSPPCAPSPSAVNPITDPPL